MRPARPTRRATTLAVMAVVVVALAPSCTDDPDVVAAADRATTTTAPATSEVPATTAPADAVGTAGVGTATTELGTVLADAAGRTLYLFTPDGTGDPTCVDQCVSAWPPLRTDGPPVPGGAAVPTLLGTVERADGSPQVTYGGHPLYSFAGDERPAEVTGQGSGGSWFVVGTDGSAVRTASGDGPAY